MLGFLLLLDQIAKHTAAGGGDVGRAVAAEVILVAHVGALHGHGNPVQRDAARGAEEQALCVGASHQITAPSEHVVAWPG